MTIHYPDISGYNAGVSLNGAPAVCIKVTEGTSFVNPDYSAALGRAHSAGAYPFAYHYLHQGNAAGQASWAHQHAGATPLMLDFEPTGSSYPQVGDATAFIDEYRRLGGIIHLNYFPHWYWQQLGSPGMRPFLSRDMFLVSSAYTAYTDEPTGAGWQPYGGQYPSIWQYTDSQQFNGQRVDFNAYRGLAGPAQGNGRRRRAAAPRPHAATVRARTGVPLPGHRLPGPAVVGPALPLRLLRRHRPGQRAPVAGPDGPPRLGHHPRRSLRLAVRRGLPLLPGREGPGRRRPRRVRDLEDQLDRADHLGCRCAHAAPEFPRQTSSAPRVLSRMRHTHLEDCGCPGHGRPGHSAFGAVSSPVAKFSASRSWGHLRRVPNCFIITGTTGR